jgi:hypothetical protein
MCREGASGSSSGECTLTLQKLSSKSRTPSCTMHAIHQNAPPPGEIRPVVGRGALKTIRTNCFLHRRTRRCKQIHSRLCANVVGTVLHLRAPRLERDALAVGTQWAHLRIPRAHGNARIGSLRFAMLHARIPRLRGNARIGSLRFSMLHARVPGLRGNARTALLQLAMLHACAFPG